MQKTYEITRIQNDFNLEKLVSDRLLIRHDI